jgi:hypothetical protein
MLTRREVLTGTAATAIAAIASARGVAAAGLNDAGYDFDFGKLQGGALGTFHKDGDGFGVFMKWDESGAEVLYKNTLSGSVEVFYRSYFKGWTPVATLFLKRLGSLEGTVAAFSKVHPSGAEFFIKGENGIGVVTTFETNAEGVQIQVTENED